jgi:hypothetical protein
MMNQDPTWRFREMSRGEINVDPIEGEFFTTEALGSLSDALIREAIQNSLDAGIPNQQVLVIISFCNSDQGLNGSTKFHYLGELDRHLTARKSGIIEVPRPDEPLNFLVIEDFGTRGLVGDTRENEDSEAGSGKPKNDFFYFWRNIGRAVEGSTARGRWGLGKTVFQATSRINSFLGLTIRNDDPRRLLMGQSVLKIHHVDRKKFAPYGYFGTFDDEDLALPCIKEEYIDAFCRDFSIQRRTEPGLSLVVPFPEKEIQPEEIIRSTLHHYFFPILSGDLVVSVKNGRQEDTLEKNSILKYLDDTDWPDKQVLRRRLEFAKWCIELPEADFIKINETETGKAPKWDEKLFESNDLENLRSIFDQGRRFAVRVPHWIHRIGNSVGKTFFDVFVERDPHAEKGEDHFVREGVTIAGVSSFRKAGIRVIVSVKDRLLSKFLGDSENPAHTEWQERSPKFKNKYNLGPTCLRYVKNSPREIISVLTRPAKGRDEKLLKDFFYIDIPPDSEYPGSKNEPTDKPGEGETDKPKPDFTGVNKSFRLQRTEGGFLLSRHPAAKAIPRITTVEVAYDVRQGNPFKKHQSLDFELDKPPISIKGKGIRVSVIKPNALQIVIDQLDFRLSITGFDPHRDLKIKTT